ncbi:MAG: Coenzyme F420 hydrogenase/dehydrogenase, beta subunit C-terminal domain [Phocaeicola sp.]|nr:Coenzyme F420 hydrogenase/dehydrogenase, beta subunit C-terminal domain [Phocaeicola sp.]
MIQLCNIKECTGCGACFNICPKNAIKMEEDIEGFLFPKINSKVCIECHLCEKVCPEINPVNKFNRVDKPIALIHKDNYILKESTSGGMFSLISNWILDNNGIIYGVILDDNFNVYHTSAENLSELSKMRGSKYVQSNTLYTFKKVKQDLKNDRLVLYSGTPCQIAGLKNYLKNVDTDKLYTIDLVCHGTPSNKMFKSYIGKLAKEKGINVNNIKDFRFRELEKWGYTPSFIYDSRRELIENNYNIYMKLFLSSRLCRKCCYSCKYTTQERIADFTLADFWDVGKKTSFDYDTKSGCSLVLLNTDKAKLLFNNVSNNAYYEYRSWEEALTTNHQLYRPSILPKDRDIAISYLLKYSLRKTNNTFFNTPYIRFRRYIGKILRALKLRK